MGRPTCLIWLTGVFAWSLITFFSPATLPAQPPFADLPILLKASDVLSPDQRVGPGFKVRETVENDGVMNLYRVDTPGAGYRVEGTINLAIMVNEIRATQALEELKGSETFTSALKRSATAPLDFGKGMITDPGGTLKGVGQGVGRWFGDVGRAIVSDDPNQQNVAETALGQAAARRHLAFQMGVDPYTRFSPLDSALDEVAWTSVAGGMPLKVTLSMVGGVAGALVNTAGTAEGMRALVRDNSPAELEKINFEKLGRLGVSYETAQQLLKNPFYTPQEITLLVGELADLKKLENCAAFITAAARVESTNMARMMRFRAQMTGVRLRENGVNGRFVTLDQVPLLLENGKNLVGIFPFDYLAWTPKLAEKADAIALDMAKTGINHTAKTLIIMGGVDAVARQELERRGWQISDHYGQALLQYVRPAGQ